MQELLLSSTVVGAIVAATEDLPAYLNRTCGVLFVDATSGDPASVIVGKGAVVFLKATGNHCRR